MTDRRNAEQPDAVEAVNRYWDALLEGGETRVLARTTHLDPEFAATIDRLQALGAAPTPRADFVRRLRGDLCDDIGSASGPEYPVKVVPNGRVPADLLPATPHQHQDRAARWSRRRTLAQLSTAALLVLTFGSIVLLAHVRQLTAPPRWPVLSAPVAQPEIATTTLIDATVPDLPAAAATIWVERWRFQPGPSVLTPDPLPEPGAWTQEPLPEPQVLAVEAGRLTLTVSGQDRVITEGDQLIIPAQQSVALRNAGPAEAVVILVTFPSRQTIVPQWDPLEITGDEAIAPFAFTLPGGPVHVQVEQQMLPPGVVLAPEVATARARFSTLDRGLQLTLEGGSLPTGWQAGEERPLTPQWVPTIAPGTVMTLRNGADVPVVLYRVRLTPVAAE